VKDIERRKFVGTILGGAGLLGLPLAQNPKGFENFKGFNAIKLKGRQDSPVSHWDVITIGSLSRNRYWGDSDEKAVHSVICTCTVISGKNFHVLVDPSIADENLMKTELDRRTGLKPDDIDLVFITHQHGDHFAGITHFQKAKWAAGAETAGILNKTGNFDKKIEPAGNNLFGAIELIPTPGHTTDHQCLRFDYKGLSVIVAGDAVATKDFWNERRPYYNALDVAESKRTMEKINSLADIIVPGHDNYFVNF
jgi:glyoxylase-like metal-dependent hydrolase (beta-lactamase superfamily II)